MARGHWLDPFARSLLEATGQLAPRPRPSQPSLEAVAATSQHGADSETAVEQELLALKLRQNPARRLQDAREVHHAAALGWRLDVNRATAADWLRLPGITAAQVDLLLRLQAGGVQLSGPDDLQRLLELPAAQVRAWEPLLLFRWYGDGSPAATASRPLDLNRATPAELQRQLPHFGLERCQRLVRERQRAPFQHLADLQERLQLPPAVVEELIGRVRFGKGPAGPELPRSA
jgi:DNA uptake protein ComE-like DNA-binding protein